MDLPSGCAVLLPLPGWARRRKRAARRHGEFPLDGRIRCTLPEDRRIWCLTDGGEGGLSRSPYTSPYAGQDIGLNYWTMPMDITQEEKIWQVLMAPITVVDAGKGEKAQVIIRSQPDKESDGVGVVTCETQGVHVLERGADWTLIECYSSSFHDSKILNWNTLVQGYVKTEYLKEVTPDQEMGMVIDKLTQRLYLFREGRLFSTLLVSTGLSNRRQPYNETRSGEFLLTSKVGTFASDNLKCAMAIRFNSGDLLHEVPYLLNRDGSPITTAPSRSWAPGPATAASGSSGRRRPRT